MEGRCARQTGHMTFCGSSVTYLGGHCDRFSKPELLRPVSALTVSGQNTWIITRDRVRRVRRPRCEHVAPRRRVWLCASWPERLDTYWRALPSTRAS